MEATTGGVGTVPAVQAEAAGRGRLAEKLVAARSSTRVLYALAALAYASFGTLFQVFPPFFNDLEHEFAIGRTLAGLSMTAFLAPVALAALFLGAAVDRHGSARIGRLGFALLIAGGGATVAANSLGLLLASRALAGLGGGMVLLATLKLLAARVPAEKLGIAFGVFVAGLPIGTGIAFDGLNHLPSWRLSTAAATGFAVLAAAVFVVLVPGGSAVRPPRSLRADLASILAPPALRQLALLVVLGYAAIVAFTTWALARREGAVAPARVRVKLAEKRLDLRASAHTASVHTASVVLARKTGRLRSMCDLVDAGARARLDGAERDRDPDGDEAGRGLSLLSRCSGVPARLTRPCRGGDERPAMLEAALAVAVMIYGVVGALASLLQLRRIRERASSQDVSLGYLSVYGAGYLLWLAYGLVIHSVPLIVADAVGAAAMLVTICVAARLRVGVRCVRFFRATLRMSAVRVSGGSPHRHRPHFRRG